MTYPQHFVVRIGGMLTAIAMAGALALGAQLVRADDEPAAPAAATAATGATAAEPRTLATEVFQGGLLADGRLLCSHFDSTFSVLDLATGAVQPWQPAWSPAQDGWDVESDGGFRWKLAVSPDGRHVALAKAVGVTHADPQGDYPEFSVAVVLSDPTGADARCVALADLTDGGPPLDFTADSARLVGPGYDPCPPTPAGLLAWATSGYAARDDAQFNYVDTATGAGGTQPGLPDYEFYTKAPLSDNFVYESLDDPALSFGSFTGAGRLGQYSAPEGRYWGYYEWVLGDTLLLTLDDLTQQLVRTDGSVLPRVRKGHAAPLWHCYCTLPDGTCLFSDDGGISFSYGQVDWPTLSVSWRVALPQLARFSEPLGEEGWPLRINKWLPLRDSSGVVVITPDAGEVALVKLSRAG
jgi:hypothetical protein